MNLISTNNIDTVLNKLHKDSKNDQRKIAESVLQSSFRPMMPSDFEHVYLPITKNQGESIRELIVMNQCKYVVEFGTSFGISTIYLADGVRQTGGKVITTELIESKAIKAMHNLSNANLSKYVEVKIGNAIQTLKAYNGPIDFLFLDGWKDLYLPLFQMLEPLFHIDTMIYADNMDMEATRVYADYVLTNTDRYATQSIDNGKGFLTHMVN